MWVGSEVQMRFCSSQGLVANGSPTMIFFFFWLTVSEILRTPVRDLLEFPNMIMRWKGSDLWILRNEYFEEFSNYQTLIFRGTRNGFPRLVTKRAHWLFDYCNGSTCGTVANQAAQKTFLGFCVTKACL